MDMAAGGVKLIADVALLARDRVLLVRYADTNTYDHQRGWFLPYDLVARGEHPDQAAARSLREQLAWRASRRVSTMWSRSPTTAARGTWSSTTARTWTPRRR